MSMLELPAAPSTLDTAGLRSPMQCQLHFWGDLGSSGELTQQAALHTDIVNQASSWQCPQGAAQALVELLLRDALPSHAQCLALPGVQGHREGHWHPPVKTLPVHEPSCLR